MAKYIEETFKKCSKCKKKTTHSRSNSKSGTFAVLMHLILIICTAGMWLLPLLLFKLMFVKVAGWTCTDPDHPTNNTQEGIE